MGRCGARQVTLVNFVEAVVHTVFHGDPAHHMIERQPGEIYLRCLICGMRTKDSLNTGPLRIAKRLEGDPTRHKMFVFKVEVPPAVPMVSLHGEVATTRRS